MAVKIFLVSGYAIYTLIRIILWWQCRGEMPTIVQTSRVRKLFFVVVDLIIIAAIIFQLTISDIGRINIREPYYSFISFFGIFLFTAGVFLSSLGRITLNGSWSTAGTIRISKEVVASGPYSAIRHPIYFGAWLVGMGFEFSLINWFFLLIIFFAPFLFLQAKFEEKMLLRFLPEYGGYMAKRGMFFPKIKIRRVIKLLVGT